MLDNNHNKVLTLLPRYCEGLVSDNERDEVEQWIGEDSERKQLVKEYKEVLAQLNQYSEYNDVDAEAALLKVKQKIGHKGKPRLILAVAVAASIAVLFVCSFFGIKSYIDQMIEPQWIEVKTNPAMVASLYLPDSTLVFLNSGSSLKYPSVFKGESRQVECEGEVYFEVTKSKKKFLVNTVGGTTVEVHGTKFNVDAYKEDGLVSTTLLEGSVSFVYNQDNGTKKEILLSPHQRVEYDVENKDCKVIDTNCEEELAWKDGIVLFKNTSMKEVLKTLSRRFDVDFIVSNPKIMDYAFTGRFEHPNLEVILKIFNASSNIKWHYCKYSSSNERPIIELY